MAPYSRPSSRHGAGRNAGRDAGKPGGQHTTSRARTRGFRALRYGVLAAVAAYACGFGYLVGTLAGGAPDETTHTDAVVVLTGGTGRLTAGLAAVKAGLAPHMFVSGVNPATARPELARANGESTDLFACCVEIGYKAADTIGNAEESAAWMREHRYTSLRLVTSDYHLPRAMLEFGRQMPGVTIVPNPVRARRQARTVPVLFAEYNKLLAAWARYRLIGAAR